MTEHRLVRMLTLTLRDATLPEDRSAVVEKVQSFVRRYRRRWPRSKWLAVLEWHPGGHGWHVHMVIDRFVPKAVIADLWGWGFVDVRRIAAGDGTPDRTAARRAATYVAKYLTKSDPEHPQPAHVKGDHRYLRPLGMKVTEVTGEGDYAELLAQAWHWWPEGVGWCWSSSEDSSWRGPRTLVMRSG